MTDLPRRSQWSPQVVQEKFTQELRAGMRQTLARVKADSEA
ncbi:MAG TPA: hypothetical protein VFY58_03275 [Nocardioides sp.]|nr:hypothetical protein [Nocardioides sp.]